MIGLSVGVAQQLYTLLLQFMTRLIFLLILINTIAYGQTDSVMNKPACGTVPETYSITVTVTNIRNHKGVIRFKFYDDTTPFPDKNGFLKVVIPKSEINGNSFTRTFFGFVSRNMAIALLDDENDNVKLDMGWLLPKEGHAFSDYYHAALRRPLYDDFDFVLTSDKQVTMKMKYY